LDSLRVIRTRELDASFESLSTELSPKGISLHEKCLFLHRMKRGKTEARVSRERPGVADREKRRGDQRSEMRAEAELPGGVAADGGDVSKSRIVA
jgi:hypothetical protein